MKSFFDFNKNKWTTDTVARLPRHDLFYGTPWNKPTAGIPIGDGDTGSLIWLEKDGIHINIGKCDLWQDAPKGIRPGEDWYNTNNEEQHTLNKHGGELVIKLDCPMFDYMYQQNFHKRLSLSEATVYSDNETPFGEVHFKAFASNREKVSILKLDLASCEETSPEIYLKRWGSRTLWRWYWQQKFAPEIGLDGTKAYTDKDGIYITQDITTTKFCLGCKIVSDKDISASERQNTHQGRITLKPSHNHSVYIYYAIRIADTTKKAMEECREALDFAAAKGEESIFSRHKRDWADFWNKSFIALADDYIENHFYLYLYYMNSASRGSHPLHFIQGPWGFYHDFVPWNYYFHYNMQHLYAPLDTTGHGDLAENYYDMRLRGLKAAKLYAENVKGKRGAFYHDVTDRYGRGADYSAENHSVGAQVAMQLYYHYLYTGDESFFHSHVLPVMQETVFYYLDMLTKEEDGLYHIHDTCGYEGTYLTDDTLSDIVMIKTLFSAFLPYAENELKDRLSDILSSLPGYFFTEMYLNDDWDGQRLLFGHQKGEKPLENGLVFAIGKNKDGSLQRRHCGSGRDLIPEGECVFPYIEFSPLYPSGLLGLKDKDTKEFNVMLNQLGLMNVPLESGMQWNLFPVFLARMGKGEEMYKAIRGMLDVFQAYPNGFNAEEGEPDCKPPFQVRQWYTPYNTNTNEVFKLCPDDFTHFDFETTPVISKAVTESLLQSHEGIIRICPATPKEHTVRFSLFAEGGFKVNAQVSENEFLIAIEKTRNESCLVALPDRFEKSTLYFYANKSNMGFTEIKADKCVWGNERAYNFSALNKGDILLISTSPINETEIIKEEVTPANMQMKQCGKAHLGTPQLMHN